MAVFSTALFFIANLALGTIQYFCLVVYDMRWIMKTSFHLLSDATTLCNGFTVK